MIFSSGLNERDLSDPLVIFLKMNTELVEACEDGDLDEVKRLVGNGGVNVNAEIFDGMTPLTSACMEGHIDVISFLIEKGADFNHPFPALSTSSAYNKLEAVKFLISDVKADVEIKCKAGRTPIFYACLHQHMKIIYELISNGADVFTEDNLCRTPFDVLEEDSKEMVLNFISEFGGKNIKGE